MSIKTVALDIGVYQKLARIKGERESFSKAIERLVDRHLTAHTGSDIASALANAPAPLSAQEADVMLRVVEDARRSEKWRQIAFGSGFPRC